MDTTDQLTAELGLPAPNQLGIVVRDVDRAAEYYASKLGIGPFTVYEFEADKYWYMDEDEPSPFRVRQGKAMLGNLEIELVYQLKGRSCFREFLETRGEGLQHLGFNVPNYDEMYERFVRAGFKPVVRVESYSEQYRGYLRACCFDTQQVGGIAFEILYKSWLIE